jgi:glucose/arabinose dehydrogenase
MRNSVKRTLVSSLVAAVTSTFGATPVQAQTCSVAVQRVLVTSATSAAVEIKHAGDDRLFIVEQEGRIRILQNGSLLAADFLDISSLSTPWFFVYYTTEATAGASLGDVVLARYSVSANPNLADPTSARILLAVPHASASNHNGGQIQFSPSNGYLYVAIGRAAEVATARAPVATRSETTRCSASCSGST